MNEAEKRRADFLGGVGVRLADGQEWVVPKPRVRFTPDDGDGFRTHLCLGAADNYQALVDAYNAAAEESRAFYERLQEAQAQAEAARLTGEPPPPLPVPPWTHSPVLTAELKLCAALLRRNYDLTGDELAEVLQFGVDPEDDPEGVRIRDEMTDIAFGVGKKPPADTSD